MESNSVKQGCFDCVHAHDNSWLFYESFVDVYLPTWIVIDVGKIYGRTYQQVTKLLRCLISAANRNQLPSTGLLRLFVDTPSEQSKRLKLEHSETLICKSAQNAQGCTSRNSLQAVHSCTGSSFVTTLLVSKPLIYKRSSNEDSTSR